MENYGEGNNRGHSRDVSTVLEEAVVISKQFHKQVSKCMLHQVIFSPLFSLKLIL